MALAVAATASAPSAPVTHSLGFVVAGCLPVAARLTIMPWQSPAERKQSGSTFPYTGFHQDGWGFRQGQGSGMGTLVTYTDGKVGPVD